jgi:hypothetical protein
MKNKNTVYRTLCCNSDKLLLGTFCFECECHATLEPFNLDPTEEEISEKVAEITLENEEDYINYMADRFGGTF